MVVEKEIDRILTLLRNKIREQSFTQLEVQEALGWGRSYISQLLTKQKSLRVEQVLRILSVIGVDPAKFYAELYHLPDSELGHHRDDFSDTGSGMATRTALLAEGSPFHDLKRDFEEQRQLVRGLVRLIIDKNLITLDELTQALKSSRDAGGFLDVAAMDAGASEA